MQCPNSELYDLEVLRFDQHQKTAQVLSCPAGRRQRAKEIDLEVAEGDFCVLLRPSGCGKTTTLRCVAGLERPDRGEIEIGGRLVNLPLLGFSFPTEKRDIGMVFQSYAIWPHMNVFHNVAFPLTQGRSGSRNLW